MRLVVFALMMVSLGCEGTAREVAEPARRPEAVVLGPEAQQVYERTLGRDAAPSCALLTEGLSEPVDALVEVAERAVAPPASSMRAASCLVQEHPTEIEPRMLRWVSERRTMGLGLLVLNHLDRFEPELAERIASAALAGEYADAARPRIARTRPELLETGSPAGPLAP